MGLRLGDIAPDFEANTTEGRIRFHEWIGDSWVVLFSHPKDFTPVCTTELGYMAKLKSEFDKRNTKLIAVSVDDVESHNRWKGDIGETQKAEESLRRGIREAGDGPNSRIFAMNLAQLYSQNGQNAKAESTVAEMYAQMPDDFEAMYTLAGLYQRRGELRKTRDLFAEWLARNPGHQYASPIAQQIQQLDAQMRTPPAPAVQAVVPTATTVQSAKK